MPRPPCPTVLHERFGDLGVLEAQYASMRDWVDAVLRDAGHHGLWAGRMQLGDWLDPSAPPDKPGQAKVDGDIVATAYLAQSLRQVADAAALLGFDEDAATYGALAERSRAAFVVALRDAGRPHDERRADRVRARAASSTSSPTPPCVSRSPTASRRSCARAATASPPASSAHPLVTDALSGGRAPRRRRAAAPPDRVPVVALPGDDGRDDRLGALGQPAARRHRSTRAR